MYAYSDYSFIVVSLGTGRVVYGAETAYEASQKAISFSSSSGIDYIIYERKGIVKTTKTTTLEFD